jgi:hypothetical protein
MARENLNNPTTCMLLASAVVAKQQAWDACRRLEVFLGLVDPPARLSDCIVETIENLAVGNPTEDDIAAALQDILNDGAWPDAEGA